VHPGFRENKSSLLIALVHGKKGAFMAVEILSVGRDDKAGIEWPAQHSALAKPFEVFCKTVFKLYCPLNVEGRENLPEPPFLICSNHASHMDSTMLMAAMGYPFKKIGLIAAKDYFFDQSHRFYLHFLLNLVPIARGTGARALKDSITACRSFLESGGYALIIYPEGTRSTSGKMARFKEGAAILSHDLDLPLVPACVIGSELTLPKGAYMIRPQKLGVRFGKSFRVADWLAFDEKSDRKAVFNAYREATVELEKRVRALLALGMPQP
jgi:1-acyl-sn-glycerol-3-phosphate acyltransferase